jgi:hypothetical protein
MSRTLPAGTLPSVNDRQQTPGQADEGPVTLRLAVLVLWIEAAALGVLTLFEIYKLATDRSAVLDLVAALFPVMTGAAAVLLAQLGRWLVHRRRWARGPAIVLQLMALPISFFMIVAGTLPFKAGGLLMVAVAVFCAGLLLAPSSRLGLTIR